MRKLLLAQIPILMAAACLPAAQRSAAQTRQVSEQALQHSIIIDTHADTPQMMLDEDYDLADPASPYMISIPKMRKGQMGGEFFSIWVPTDWPRQDLVHRALDLIDVVNEQVGRHPDTLGLARSAEDVVRLHREHKIAILMGLEGGHIIINDLRVLDNFYRLGVRYMTLTHTQDTDWADSSGDTPRHNGLTSFGRQVVERMNRLGMMVDISHVSDKTFYDALAVTKAPVVASHSSCRALCDAPRNMTDDMIRALAKNGGVMDINFYSAFLDPGFRAAQNGISRQVDAAIEAARKEHAREGKTLTYAEETAIRVKMQAHLTQPSYKVIADHIDHAVKVGGIDHVGLGSDFDGVDAIPRGMEDVSQLPSLVAELARRGYSKEDLQKILGGNVLRVMREVARVSQEMQTGGSSQ
jgi:membrane dipeptidase